MNVGNSKVMVFERKEVEVCDFNTYYRVNVPVVGRCEVVLGERTEEVKEFKYLGTALCKHGDKGKNKREGCER